MADNLNGSFAFIVDKGLVREENQDQAFALINGNGEALLIVCDGMGGQKKGDFASKIAMDCLIDSFKHKKKNKYALFDRLWFSKSIKKANSMIFEKGEKDDDYKGSGTTLVAILITDDRLMIANMGDSRAYLATKERITQLTEDQTYVHYLVKTGKISEKEALVHPDRHVLNNALGIYPSVSLDLKTMKYGGEKILLCTDGLYNQVPLADIHAHMFTDDRPEQKLRALVKEAETNGGSDNVGIVLWEVGQND